jgi:ABC-type lipoprotein export system ATPase subunit
MIATPGFPTSLAIPLKSALLGDLMPPPDAAPSLSEAPLLKVEGVGKSYGLRAVLAEVCLTVGAGERLALTGPSGSGKTTLLNCIGGVDRPDTGAIFLEDSRIDRLDNAALARVRRERIGTIFQFFHLLPTLTVAENVELPLQLLRVPLAARTERVRALLERVGLTARSAALPSQLSGGEQQRVAIARALVHRPTLLLADEPTGNLDSANGGKILALLREMTDEARPALVLVTHSEAAAAICHRRLHLRDGRIVAET